MRFASRCARDFFAAGRALAAVVILSGSAVAEDLITPATFGENPGDLTMRVYRPQEVGPGAPLVVALHGCLQHAEDIDNETGLTDLADLSGFTVVFPEQREANNRLRCFNWFDEDDNRPGRGESASILAMIDWALAEYRADPARVYVLGLSAGGAMAAALMADYPERFAGGAVVAGTPFDCNQPTWLSSGVWFSWYWLGGPGAAAAYACGLDTFVPTDRSAEHWGDLVRAMTAGAPARWPRVSLWHGSNDQTVDSGNLDELVEQWTNVHGLDGVAPRTETVSGAARRVYSDADGVAQVEAWLIPGFPHAFPVDPDDPNGRCGAESSYIADANLCAARRIAEFWGLWP